MKTIGRLSDIYDFQYGKGNENPDNGGIYPVYGSNGIIGGYDKFNSEDAPVIGHIGANAGSVVFAKGKHFVTYNGVICRIKDCADKMYGYYALLTSNLKKVAFGSAQPFVSYNSLNRIAIYLPPIEKQKKISSILSTYDELIENNNKRIAILEQMAENLYKEWFVRFRFPGYETVNFEEKKPFGWIVASCENTKIPSCFDYCEFSELGSFTRGRNITAAEMVEGDIPVISAGLQPSGYHNKANVTGKSLTISASGANAGYLQYNLSDIWAADCSYYQNEKNLWFVYCTLKFLQPVISNFQCGAAQPHVYPKNINKLCILKPTDELIVKFNQTVEPFFDEIETLKKKNDNFTKQRDLLLPRLMSGKLEVSNTTENTHKAKVISFEQFVSKMGLAARAKFISDSDLKAMYEAYIDDDETE